MEIGQILIQVIDDVRPQLEQLDEKAVEKRPGPGKWSAKEILGHLIDSATNNHRRFVLAHTRDDLIFDGYDQERWVKAQNYQGMEWQQIVGLWHAYNVHLAHFMPQIPEPVRTKVHIRHNFNTIAMRAVPLYSPITLEYLMRDYVWHLEHHLLQILPDYERRLHW